MSNALRIELGWDVQQLSVLQQALKEQATLRGWEEALQAQLDLIAEELVVNVMTHGQEGRSASAGTGWVRFELTEVDGVIELTVSDNGVPYDPTKQAQPDLNASLEERERGGLGISFVRELADTFHYEYREGANVVTVRKRRDGPV